MNKQGKFVVWKDGTWLYLQDGNSWEYEGDKDWLLTIDLSKKETFKCVDCKTRIIETSNPEMCLECLDGKD